MTHYIKSLEKVVSKSIRHVGDADDFLSFQDAAEAISKVNRNCIVSDAVTYPSAGAAEMLRTLKTHLFAHVVRMQPAAGGRAAAGDLYTQTQVHRHRHRHRHRHTTCVNRVTSLCFRVEIW